MFGKWLFGNRGISSLLATYRERKALRQKLQRKLDEWAQEDFAWSKLEQDREQQSLEREAQRSEWKRLEKEWNAAKVKWPNHLVETARAQDGKWKRDFRQEMVSTDAVAMLDSMRKVGSPERIAEAIIYLENLARSMKDLQDEHIKNVRAGVNRANDGQLWRSAGQGPGTSEGIHSHGF